MKRALWIGIAVTVGLVVIFGATCVNRYNGLVRQREAVDGGWAQVENVLQRRADLIPNLVQTVKGYASHEREVFTEVAQARSRLLAATGPAEATQANRGFESALGRLLAIAERYPDLKANRSFIQLQDELAGTENRIAVERKRYNDLVRAYNAEIRSFPTNIMAGIFGFERQSYFEAAEGAEKVPKVEFEREEPGAT